MVEFEKAKTIMAKKEIIELGELHQIKSMWPQICVMLANLTEAEFSRCLEEKKLPDTDGDVTALHDALQAALAE